MMQGLVRWLFPSLLGSFLVLSPSQEKEIDQPMVELNPIQPIQFEYVQPILYSYLLLSLLQV